RPPGAGRRDLGRQDDRPGGGEEGEIAVGRARPKRETDGEDIEVETGGAASPRPPEGRVPRQGRPRRPAARGTALPRAGEGGGRRGGADGLPGRRRGPRRKAPRGGGEDPEAALNSRGPRHPRPRPDGAALPRQPGGGNEGRSIRLRVLGVAAHEAPPRRDEDRPPRAGFPQSQTPRGETERHRP